MDGFIRVLQINAGSRNFGGVSAMVLNIYRNIDRSKIQFDFLTPNVTTYEMYRSEIEGLGGHVFDFGIDNDTFSGKFKFARALKKFLKNHPYDIIHINSGCLSFNCLSARAVKRADKEIKVAVHSHSSGARSRWKNSLSAPLKWIMERNADLLLACSANATEYMYLKRTIQAGRTHLIRNGIDVKRFQYREDIKNEVRKDLGLADSLVIGNVGRFLKEKNHEFIIDIFEKLEKQNHNVALLLIGQGELEDNIKKKVSDLHLDDKVFFLGQRSDVERFYQAMDIFLLPSEHEGFPVTLIEAQASGLPCIVSTAVPEEVNVCGLVNRISLKESVETWVQEIIEAQRKYRVDYCGELIQKGFDIKETADELSKLYYSVLQQTNMDVMGQ